MTAEPTKAPNLRTAASAVDLERLHVASQRVLDWTSDLANDAPGSAELDQLTHHARLLVEMRGMEATPFAAIRAHALNVRNELILLATERSLTLAVWFDDALGLRTSASRPIPTDPAEDA
ncbi:hypothetical protein [Actinomycetospora cinnamomea]|uniref:Uncharacterized protein n=1 Tax=Actinomycetospora cinnamomea TaxID=663609 RepID=A0A2U1EBH5_9PSEU|nr:hypothetical protein [Actinomycetospora cinnamomea]PVY97260.1 hypothetical protein C8D89_1252 [Actinomycetospora cinnamomea]